jgi:hypothetical protein
VNETELSDLFRKLGARDPAVWARSQIEDGVPQLARFLFLRAAWNLVVDEGDRGWLTKAAHERIDQPGGGLAPALARLLEAGAQEHDLTTVVRVMQWRLLSGLCVLLDDCPNLEPEVKHIAWRLFQVNNDGAPVAKIGGLIESVLETDPSGREMRPR